MLEKVAKVMHRENFKRQILIGKTSLRTFMWVFSGID